MHTVDELGLAEALQAKDLRVGHKGAAREGRQFVVGSILHV
jgi:hypothetical protein